MYTPVTEARPISPSAGIKSAVDVVVQIEGRRRAAPSRYLGVLRGSDAGLAL
jgi:hypothetical protein